MDRADFIHLVRLYEQSSEEDSQAYRRGVAAFAALGYAWVLGCLLLAIGVLAWTGSQILRGQFNTAYLWGVIGAAGLLWTSLQAVWINLDGPQGQRLTPADAPALFEALDRIRRKVKGPPIHGVYLDAEFNASIQQRPRFGLFGGTVNDLTIGLPLLLAIDRPRFLAVLAHEYGHLRGDHGRFAAWIYRTRLSWGRLSYSLRHDEGPVAAATQAFLRWYFPRFIARTFAMARQDEYEADRIASRLLGRDVMGAALTEITVKGAWLGGEFWAGHWRTADLQALPVGPFTAMRKLLALPPPDQFARDTLHAALRRISDVDDTHPVLRDRLEALQASKGLPAWSARPAIELLGTGASRWVAHFDHQWCKDNASEWKLHHTYLGRVRARVGELAASAARNNADEMTQLGDLRRRLDDQADVQANYERALLITPGHAGALRGLVQCLPLADQARRLQLLDSLYENSAMHRWWACKRAVQALEKPGPDGSMDDKALKLWRERLRQADDAEERAWQELAQPPFLQAISRHDLNEFELGELRVDLSRCLPVARAWLVRKNLREFPHRRCYLAFVDLPELDDEDSHDLCQRLERSLDLPGQVVVLWAGHSPTLDEIERHAFEPVYAQARA